MDPKRWHRGGRGWTDIRAKIAVNKAPARRFSIATRTQVQSCMPRQKVDSSACGSRPTGCYGRRAASGVWQRYGEKE